MADTPDYVNGEPEPIHNFNTSVHDLLVNDAKQRSLGFGRVGVHDTIIHKMIDLFRARKAYGLKKYGTILQADNGRDFFKDAVEESIDQLAYIRQGLDENPGNEILTEAYRLGVSTLRSLLIFDRKRQHEKMRSDALAAGKPDPMLRTVPDTSLLFGKPSDPNHVTVHVND